MAKTKCPSSSFWSAGALVEVPMIDGETVVIVRVRRPRGATDNDVLRYVRTAVSSWCGSLEPPHEDLHGNGDDSSIDGDPMFMLRRSTRQVGEVN